MSRGWGGVGVYYYSTLTFSYTSTHSLVQNLTTILKACFTFTELKCILEKIKGIHSKFLFIPKTQ